MTRREEIIAEAKKHEYDWGVDVDRFDVPDIFAKGAEWADKTMIEKAVEWIKENFASYIGADVSPYYIYDDEFADDFRKAMEE